MIIIGPQPVPFLLWALLAIDFSRLPPLNSLAMIPPRPHDLNGLEYNSKCLHLAHFRQPTMVQRPQHKRVSLEAHTQGASSEGKSLNRTGGMDISHRREKSGYTWDIYVSQSNSAKDRGVIPLISIIDAFVTLTPFSADVKVYSAQWNAISKSNKGYCVRCIQRKKRDIKRGEEDEIVSAIEVGNVDSVDKVYRIMTEHLKLGEINPDVFDCLRCYFEGNERLEEEKPSLAISLYNKALSSEQHHKDIVKQLPKGNILMKRARAYLKRAANHRKMLRILVKDLVETVPTTPTVQHLYEAASTHSPLSAAIFQRLSQHAKIQQGKFRQTRYRHEMHEFAILYATQDSLQATQLLPQNARAWLLAGECLAELRKFKESEQYYQRALELDLSLEHVIKSLMERDRVSQEFMQLASASGFSGDILRLALDVAA